MLTRRSFLRRLGAAVIAGALVRHLPGLAPALPAFPPPLEGISMRMVRDFDVSTDGYVCRLDVLYGIGTVRPELACRIEGA